ncbi:MAG: Spy/CpxP family protein refolding chaperone [Burkholderiaceae bacterium]|nr:Spy/CpxP family protein refolding chaperone [Burkholderiaceae bacterium]
MKLNLPRSTFLALALVTGAALAQQSSQTPPPAPGTPPAGQRWGPGMMGYGPGYGPGYGTGPGIGRALWALDLDEAQRKQALAIQDDLRRKRWELAGKAQEEMAKLRDARLAPRRDRAAILAAYKRLGELRQQSVEQSLDAADRLDKVLTEQQREQLRRWGPSWMHGGGE